jgi:NADH:ubiquinone oxidoreductase subunit 5 (subunit L)/multisubunit Na+/H+ antiporter MnhA subunit
MTRHRSDPPLPLRPVEETHRPTPAPAWLALVTAWLGLIMLLASIVFIFLPGSQSPREELEHLRQYSLADRFLPLPIYGIAVVLFLGIVVFWQMRREPRPLPDALIAQRVQAWVGIGLALTATVIIYTWVGLRGPR